MKIKIRDLERERLIKHIEGEIKFLNCQGIKWLVHEADIGNCHQDSETIENRKKKLKKELASLKI